MTMLQTLTPSEEEVMKLIWKDGSMYFRDLMTAFPEPKPHQNTVSTFLKILVEKNYLETEKQGRINLYKPAIKLTDYKIFVLKKFLENYFDNSASELIKTMMDENLLKSDDFSQLPKEQLVSTKENKNSSNDPIKELVNELTSNKKNKKKDHHKKKKKKK